jgi:hypothetical protein
MTPALHLDLDPGRKGFGWAARLDTTLIAAGAVPPPPPPRDFARAPAVAVAEHAELAIRCALLAAGVPPSGPVAASVGVEYMVHYPPKRARRVPGRTVRQPQEPDEKARTAIANDLIELQAIGALVARAFVMMPSAITYRTAPQWKGSTDTDVIERRLSEWWGWLPEELPVWNGVMRLPLGLRHNAVDAGAMSLVRAGRFRL